MKLLSSGGVQRARLRVLALVLAFVAGGCAAPGPMPPVGPVKRVGIVSLIGDRVQWSYFAASTLDNRSASITAADWGLDAAAASAAQRGLAAGIDSVMLTPTPRLRAAVNQPLTLEGWYGTGNAAIVIPALTPVVEGKNLDVVIVLRRVLGDNDTASVTRTNGVGVTSRFDPPGRADAYLWVVAFAYDLRAQRGIAEAPVRAGGPAPGGRTLPLVALPSDLTAALQGQRTPLRDALVSMFDEYLPPAVKQLGLR
ncbi:MAG: hypothetical protein ABI777_09730 [Betaproteobacteria bacterium]